MYKLKGKALAAIKKEKLSKSKLNSKTKFKKKGGTESEVRYRPRR
jgi:hypothetical protein